MDASERLTWVLPCGMEHALAVSSAPHVHETSRSASKAVPWRKGALVELRQRGAAQLSRCGCAGRRERAHAAGHHSAGRLQLVGPRTRTCSGASLTSAEALCEHQSDGRSVLVGVAS